MTTDLSDVMQGIILWAPAILFAITLHEWAHGYAASLFGDDTARKLGRLTLNPIPHIDPVWTVAIPVFLLVTSLATTGQPFVFGGAKPVPINPRNFRPNSFKAALFWVAVAGPLMNLVLAAFCALLLHPAELLPAFFSTPLLGMLVASVKMNVFLAAFNLLPIPPLDGGRVMVALLPTPLDRRYAAIEPIGLPLVIVAAFGGVLDMVLKPVVSVLLKFYVWVAGLM